MTRVGTATRLALAQLVELLTPEDHAHFEESREPLAARIRGLRTAAHHAGLSPILQFLLEDALRTHLRRTGRL